MIYRWQRVNVGYVFEGTEMFAMQRAALLRIHERTFVMNAQQLGARAPRPQFFRKLKIFVFTARVFLCSAGPSSRLGRRPQTRFSKARRRAGSSMWTSSHKNIPYPNRSAGRRAEYWTIA